MRDVACVELLRHITELLDGTLDPDLEAAIHEHLDGCDDCTAAIDQMRLVMSLARDTSTPAAILPAETRRRLVEEFLRRDR
jgi:predicted anti-sigma-YlaC factor YlaD